MDQIEQQVQLPRGARPFADYARYYAPGRDGKVLGIYVIPFPPPAPGESCGELTESFEMKDVPCSPMETQPESIEAGQRLWMRNEMDLPVIHDGGCSVINVTFDPQTRKLEQVACNGFA